MKKTLSNVFSIVILSLFIFIAFGSDEEETTQDVATEIESSSSTEDVAQEISDAETKQNNWTGTFEGTCPSYNMKNSSGQDMMIQGKPITLPPIKYVFEIYNNNISSIISEAEGSKYNCKNVKYDATENKLTMYPVAGSDCGGHPFVIVKDGELFSVSSKGQPDFQVTKTK